MAMSDFRTRARSIQEKGIAPLIVLIVLLIMLFIGNPASLSGASISVTLDQAAVLLLLATAQCLIILMGRIGASRCDCGFCPGMDPHAVPGSLVRGDLGHSRNRKWHRTGVE